MSIDVAILPGSVSRLAGGLFTSVRRLSESINEQVAGEESVVRARVVGNRDDHTNEDLTQWKQSPELLQSPGRRAMSAELFRWLQQHEPDIVHPQFIWSYASMATLRWRGQDSRRRHVISPRGMLDPWAVQHSRWKKRIAGLLFESNHLRTAACIHALCDSEAQSIRRFGLRNPICVIPNGIDVPSDPQLRQWQRERGGLKGDGRRTMLFVGRVHKKKGLLQLIEAWHKAKSSLSDWRLVIAGWDDGGHQQQLEQAVQQWSLETCVEFAGPLYGQAKTDALSNADAFVLPSFSEGLPMAVLEAWAYRLPVLMTAQCNLSIGFESESAMEIHPEVDALSRELDQFTDTSEQQLNKMGMNGRRLVVQHFQWNTIAGQMTDVYRWVLGQRDAPECVIG